MVSLVLLVSMVEPGFAVQVKIENHEGNSEIRYPVMLLKGTAEGKFAEAEIVNRNARIGAGKIRPVFHKGKFKALVELSAGKNVIEFRGQGDSRSEFTIRYRPQTNPYYVRVIWMTDKDGDTKFAAPNDKAPQDYEARLRTAAELMQTFTAERMHEMGLGRKTFRLERDEQGRVVVHTLKAQQTAEHYYGLNDQVWWQDVYRWINTRHPDEKAKNMVLASFTRKDPKTGKMKAHTALGGGNLGLFGSASVFSWPRSISSATETFLDTGRYDSSKVHDDSVGRSTIWGLASTTIGATLHEMGHTFGLMHVQDPQGIMSRGFDHFNRTFTFVNPISGRNSKPEYFDAKQEARFADISVSFLQWSKWFQLDAPKLSTTKRPVITYNSATKIFTVESEAGIPWVGFMSGPHDVAVYTEFKQDPLPKSIKLSTEKFQKEMGSKKIFRITTIDAAGMRVGLNLPQK